MVKGPFWSALNNRGISLVTWVVLLLCGIVLGGQAWAVELAAAQPRKHNSVAAKSGAGTAPEPQNSASWSIVHRDARSTVTIYYPQLDNIVADNELGYWADVRLRTFVTGVAALGEGKSRYSMHIDYTLSMADPRYVSVVFRITTDTGGGRPDLGLTTFTYDLKDGRGLSFKDIFSDPEGLLAFLSLHCEEEFTFRLGRYERERIKRGTAPNELNFSYFAIVPEGLQLFFPPYQVASSSLGEQQLVVPLEKLMSYGPNLEIWGKDNRNFRLNP